MRNFANGNEPYRPPVDTETVDIVNEGKTPAERVGLPWEENGPSIKSFFQTILRFFDSQRPIFQVMKLDGGFSGPLTFCVSCGIVAGTLITLWEFTVAALTDSESNEYLIAMAALVLFIVPIVYVIQAFFFAFSFHVLLRLLNVGKHGFEATFRVAAYSVGLSGLASIIPAKMVSLIVFVAFCIDGLVRVHEISKLRSAVTVLIPTTLIFAVAVALGIFMASLD